MLLLQSCPSLLISCSLLRKLQPPSVREMCSGAVMCAGGEAPLLFVFQLHHLLTPPSPWKRLTVAAISPTPADRKHFSWLLQYPGGRAALVSMVGWEGGELWPRWHSHALDSISLGHQCDGFGSFGGLVLLCLCLEEEEVGVWSS